MAPGMTGISGSHHVERAGGLRAEYVCAEGPGAPADARGAPDADDTEDGPEVPPSHPPL